ncbi:hypothetical protein MTR67_031189, partial [Solanum verrucosum]
MEEEIEIEKITEKTSRMVTFSKRRKGLFRKIEKLESLTGMNSHACSSDVDVVSGRSFGLKSSSTSKNNSLRGWVEAMKAKGQDKDASMNRGEKNIEKSVSEAKCKWRFAKIVGRAKSSNTEAR